MATYLEAVAAILAAAHDCVERRVPYRFGGTTAEGVDCSGLTLLCYRQAGIDLPRTAQGQREASVALSEAEARPGDLLFLTGTYSAPELGPNDASHVGIWLGDGAIINALSENRPVCRTEIAQEGYWGKPHFWGRPRALQQLFLESGGASDLGPIPAGGGTAPVATPPPATVEQLTIARVAGIPSLLLHEAPGLYTPAVQVTPNPMPVGMRAVVVGGPVPAEGRFWWRLLLNGRLGWSSSRFLAPDTADPLLIVAGTDGDQLRVRAGPGRASPVRGALGDGALVRLLELPQAADGFIWCHITDGALDGWAAADWLRTAPPGSRL